MNRYVKIRRGGTSVISPYLLYVDKNHTWLESEVEVENKKSVNIAKMAFLDHGVQLDSMEMPGVEEQTAAYTKAITDDTVLLISEGGMYMLLTTGMEIVNDVYSDFYPIDVGAAIVCENDPFDKWFGSLDDTYLKMAKAAGSSSVHYMYSFHCRDEQEIIDAFSNTNTILINSSYTEIRWFELLLRCIIKSGTRARIVALSTYDNLVSKRKELCISHAKKYGIEIEVF